MSDNHPIFKYLPDSIQDRSELAAFCGLAASISAGMVSIAASQILLAVAIVGAVWTLRRGKDYIPLSPWNLLPLLTFMVWTLIAVFASSNVTEGLEISKKFYLFLLVPIVPLILHGEGRLNWIYRAIFVFAAVSSLKGIAQFIANPDRDLLHRITGFMSMWMTYSGLLMLALVLLIAYAFAAGVRRHLWIIPVGILIVVALLLTQTRNAWVGAVGGLTVLVLIWKPRAFVILIAAVLACYALSPATRARIRSGMDPADPNTRNRIELFQTSMRLIRDNPWLGVGPKNVSYEALRYRNRDNEYPDWMYQHMHNNFLQIAAETGIPGLIIWLWFMGRLGWDALACYRNAGSALFPDKGGLRREALMASSAALASLAALMLAGMFEYNFGDSEVLTLFLFIASAPYAFTIRKNSAPVSADGSAPLNRG